METMTLEQAQAAYREFVGTSDEPEEMGFESWCDWEGIKVVG